MSQMSPERFVPLQDQLATIVDVAVFYAALEKAGPILYNMAVSRKSPAIVSGLMPFRSEPYFATWDELFAAFKHYATTEDSGGPLLTEGDAV